MFRSSLSPTVAANGVGRQVDRCLGPIPATKKRYHEALMEGTVAEIEEALATVKHVLDALTTRGNDEAAFDLAKAQYSASVRTSWPSNLSSLIRPLVAVGSNASMKLTDEERAAVRQAIAILKRACNQ
jgi:hypothetical protein